MLLFNALSVYGLIYALGFLLFVCIRHPFVRYGNLSYRLFIALYTSIGVILGGRLFYVIIYEPAYYASNLLEILELYKGGMSFHGGLVLCILTIYILDKKHFLINLDRASICAMLLIPVGRIVNFLNGELYGRATLMPFAFIFEGAGEIPRHPSQLYEALAEGPLIALIIFVLYRRGSISKAGEIAFYFALLYAIFRFVIEFTREPDLSVGFVATYFSAGQILCVAQLLLALIFYRVFIYKSEKLK